MSEVDQLRDNIVSIATEAYRFGNAFDGMLEKMSFDDRKKYSSQFAWFKKRVDKAVNDAGYDIVDLKGQPYDPGMAVKPINIEDFDVDDDLYVDYLIEPIIMRDGTVIKEGTAILKGGCEQ